MFGAEHYRLLNFTLASAGTGECWVADADDGAGSSTYGHTMADGRPVAVGHSRRASLPALCEGRLVTSPCHCPVARRAPRVGHLF